MEKRLSVKGSPNTINIITNLLTHFIRNTSYLFSQTHLVRNTSYLLLQKHLVRNMRLTFTNAFGQKHELFIVTKAFGQKHELFIVTNAFGQICEHELFIFNLYCQIISRAVCHDRNGEAARDHLLEQC